MIEEHSHQLPAPNPSFQVFFSRKLVKICSQEASMGHFDNLPEEIHVMPCDLGIDTVLVAETRTIQINQQFTDNDIVLRINLFALLRDWGDDPPFLEFCNPFLSHPCGFRQSLLTHHFFLDKLVQRAEVTYAQVQKGFQLRQPVRLFGDFLDEG